MQKWEYHNLDIRVEGKTITYFAIDGDSQQTGGGGLNRILDTQGERGWELIAIEGFTFYFKRPKD